MIDFIEVFAMKGQICPVCGKHTFIEDDGYEICPICKWEDDKLQRDYPDYRGGANYISLNEFREEWAEKCKEKKSS